MAEKKDKAGQGIRDVQDHGGAGGQDRQAEGGDGSLQSGFLHSSPEANVFPPGAAQRGKGNADGKAGGSAAGTPEEGKLGGSGGTSASGTTGNDPDR